MLIHISYFTSSTVFMFICDFTATQYFKHLYVLLFVLYFCVHAAVKHAMLYHNNHSPDYRQIKTTS